MVLRSVGTYGEIKMGKSKAGVPTERCLPRNIFLPVKCSAGTSAKKNKFIVNSSKKEFI